MDTFYRFYCAFQNSEQPPQQILGSRVNDGVCDCCDGSDEWAGTQVYGGVHVKGDFEGHVQI